MELAVFVSVDESLHWCALAVRAGGSVQRLPLSPAVGRLANKKKFVVFYGICALITNLVTTALACLVLCLAKVSMVMQV